MTEQCRCPAVFLSSDDAKGMDSPHSIRPLSFASSVTKDVLFDSPSLLPG